MKPKFTASLLILALACIPLLTGCGAVHKTLGKEVIVPAYTNSVYVPGSTPFVVEPAKTNADGFVTPPLKGYIVPEQKAYIPDESKVNGVSGMLGLIPVYGQPAAAIFGVLIAAFFHNEKKKIANTAKDTNTALIQGIQGVFQIIAATGPSGQQMVSKFKGVLSKAQDEYQVRGLVNNILDEVTHDYGKNPELIEQVKAAFKTA